MLTSYFHGLRKFHENNSVDGFSRDITLIDILVVGDEFNDESRQFTHSFDDVRALRNVQLIGSTDNSDDRISIGSSCQMKNNCYHNVCSHGTALRNVRSLCVARMAKPPATGYVVVYVSNMK